MSNLKKFLTQIKVLFKDFMEKQNSSLRFFFLLFYTLSQEYFLGGAPISISGFFRSSVLPSFRSMSVHPEFLYHCKGNLTYPMNLYSWKKDLENYVGLGGGRTVYSGGWTDSI